MPWKILKSETIFKNNFFSVQKDKCKKTDGSIINAYYSLKRPDAAVIAAFTSKMELIMIEQYRHPVKAVDYEIPAGYIEPHEKNIRQAARRELLEETGYKVDKLIKLKYAYTYAGLLTNTVHFFIGFNAKKIQKQKLDQSEELNLHIIKWPKALKMLMEGKVKDLGSVTGILLAKNYLKK